MTNPGYRRNESGNAGVRFLADAKLAGKPYDAFVLAAAAGLRTRAVRDGIARGLAYGVIHYDARTSREAQDEAITRAVALWAVRWYRLEETDEALSMATEALRWGRQPLSIATLHSRAAS